MTPLLTRLSLDYNRLTTDSIHDGAFRGPTNMYQMSISHNKLTSIKKGWLQGVTFSEGGTLRFRDNSILSIEKQALSGLGELNYLYLELNPLSAVTPESFDGLTELILLDLSFSNVTFVPGFFQHTPNLGWLKLHGLHFKYVPGMFEGVKLHELDLSETHLTELNPDMWSELKFLGKLILKGNNFHTIPVHAFMGLDVMYYLNLENCNIKHIKALAFDQLPELNTIFLWGNPLLSLDGTIFGGKFEERPGYKLTFWLPDYMQCNSVVCWLKREMNYGNLNTPGFDSYIVCKNSNDMTMQSYFETHCIE